MLQLFAQVTNNQPKKKYPYSYLALGDDYAIGAGVKANENFPNLTRTICRAYPFEFDFPTIIAQTGWTTDELAAAIKHNNVRKKYTIVTLNIGANDQKKGLSIEQFKLQFEQLLRQSIVFTGGKPRSVFVVSIPDWGATPFAEGRDRQKITREIDSFNAAQKEITIRYNCRFIDITKLTREHSMDPEFLAPDKLHPSYHQYEYWSEMMYSEIENLLLYHYDK